MLEFEENSDLILFGKTYKDIERARLEEKQQSFLVFKTVLQLRMI